jgi:ubiquinone/menaquinone biosynthesis C-methylase UbiE
MLKNAINSRDFYDLFHAAPAVLSRLGLRIRHGEQQLIKSAWQHIEAPPTNWWDIPAVRMRWNDLITGSASVEYHQYTSEKWLKNRSNLLALSLGCGTGHNELIWAKLNRFERIDAYDLSAHRIQTASEAAAGLGYGNLIRYAVGDVFDIEVKESLYDVIVVEQSLHHFSPLDKILSRIAAFLKKDGFFFINEFVGPTRFQWTDRQIEAVNGLLAVLPIKFKTLWKTNDIKRKMVRPSHLRMILGDPSEAVESDRIVPLLRTIFDVIELKGYGGSILHLLFNGIAHNFLNDDPETKHYLKMIFDVEDLLLQSQDIQHDFVVAVCCKR